VLGREVVEAKALLAPDAFGGGEGGQIAVRGVAIAQDRMAELFGGTIVLEPLADGDSSYMLALPGLPSPRQAPPKLPPGSTTLLFAA